MTRRKLRRHSPPVGCSLRPLRFESLEARLLLAGVGLTGQYFHNPDFSGLAFERTEAVDFAWGDQAPAPGVAPDSFSVRWLGQVEPLYSETYTFSTSNNQGVRLWVDGELLVDQWQPQVEQIPSGTIALESGQRYDLRLDYFHQSGSAGIALEWMSPSQSQKAIPASQLHVSPEGVWGVYTDNFGGSGTRLDSQIDFNWGLGRPHPSVAVDWFNVTWTGYLQADFSEEYTFSLTSDEGARLWVGGELVIDDWEPHTAQITTGTKTLEAGKWYDLRLDYYDNTAHARVQLAWASDNQTGTGEPGSGQVQVVHSTHLRAMKATPQMFSNPLGPGQDPFVVQWNDMYLHIRSGWGQVVIDSAEQLQDIHSSSPNSVSTVAWTAPPNTNYSHQIWAPELFQIDDKWYIYVAASDGNNETHRMHVLMRDHPDPRGAFTYMGQIQTTPDRWAIDGTILEWEDQLYFIWSGWPGFSDGVQNLYIAEMSDPLTISSNRVVLSTPQHPWERHGLHINEGPQVLKYEDKLHIVYSASGYWRHEYALGLLTYNGVGPIMDPTSWQKSPQPVFQQSGDIVGTGHAYFTQSPDGTEWWLVYHAHHDKNNWQDNRDIYMQPFTFDNNGYPQFGQPIPADTRLPVPSPGIPDGTNPLVPADFDADGKVGASDLRVWEEQFGMQVFPGTSADASGNGLVDGSDFLSWQRNFVEEVIPPPEVAYWRHEEGVPGDLVASGDNTVLDSSGKGNHMRRSLSVLSSATYSTTVSPLPLRSGEPNTMSLNFTPNRNNYTAAKPINSYLFEEMTVEFAFNMNSVGGFQALVGKDGKPLASSPLPPLKIMVRGDDFPGGTNNQLFVEWIDGNGNSHYLAGGSTIAAGNWNHVAFTLTENTAQLWVADETGLYTVADAVGGNFSGPQGQVLYATSSNFTVGRGMYNNNAADWANALIDEVRISNRALSPSEFLFDVAPQSAVAMMTVTAEVSGHELGLAETPDELSPFWLAQSQFSLALSEQGSGLSSQQFDWSPAQNPAELVSRLHEARWGWFDSLPRVDSRDLDRLFGATATHSEPTVRDLAWEEWQPLGAIDELVALVVS